MPIKNSSEPKPPRSEAQRQAARRNGAKSKGPVSPEGKAISCLNSSRHGITAEKTFVLANESRADFHHFCDAFIQRYQPADPVERDLCIEMAHARWRLHRAWTIETALIDTQMEIQNEALVQRWNIIDEGTRMGEAWKGLADESRSLALLHRYEARLRRIFERALANLTQLQRDRAQPQPEPDSNTNPTNPSRDREGADKNLQNEPEPRPSLVLVTPKPSPEPLEPLLPDQPYPEQNTP